MIDPPLYLKFGGADYVLRAHAEKHLHGMADDTMMAVLLLVKGLRPEDKALHEDIAALREGRKEGPCRDFHAVH